MGITLLMIAEHFDLSVGSVLGFSSVIAPYLILNYDAEQWCRAHPSASRSRSG